MKSSFRSRITQCMAEKHLNQAELARAARIRPSSLSDYLTGKYQPKQDKIARMAAALEVSPAWLMGYDDPDEDSALLLLSGPEKELLLLFRSLTKEQQASVRSYISDLAEKD